MDPKLTPLKEEPMDEEESDLKELLRQNIESNKLLRSSQQKEDLQD